MISKLAELMYREHAIILEGAQIASSLDKSWEINANEYEKNVRELLDFFVLYADHYHHIKEETVLFPALQETGQPAVTAIISELTEHHEHFRELLGKIRTDISHKEYPSAQKKLMTYISDLQNHIAAENDELFPMAESMLDEKEMDKLYFDCIDKDRELGVPQKEKLENFITNFKFNINEAAN